MKFVYLSASKISVITGDNRFESLKEYLISIWKKYNKSHYFHIKEKFDNEREKAIQNIEIKDTIKRKLKKENIYLDIELLTKKELIKNIEKLEIKEEKKIELKKEIKNINNIDENKPECKKEVTKIVTDYEIVKKAKLDNELKVKSKNVKELNKNKEKVIEKVNMMNISNKEKEVLKKSINSISNKRYGTNREKVTVEYFKEKYDKEITINKKKHLKFVNKVDDIDFFIVGEIDGLLENDTIVEIKNRTKRLFNRLYNYEKVQMYMYMYILNKRKCVLIEHFNDELGEIHSDFDELYMSKILKKIKKFSNFYYRLLSDIIVQRATLLGNDKDFLEIYNSSS